MKDSLKTKHIAVIGSGIAGIASAWLLDKKYKVTLIEKNSYIGGHTNTIKINGKDKDPVPVDTGFIVYNAPNYPNLVGLFNELDVETRPTNMSFSVSSGDGKLEYAGSNLATLFAQKSNLFKPRFLRMVSDIIAFNKDAKKLIDNKEWNELTVGQFLRLQGYGKGFANDYLLPMAAAIWSCPPSQMAEFPVHSFAQFFNNHGLLNIKNRPQWRTVVGGSSVYIQKLLNRFSGNVISNNQAVSIKRQNNSVTIRLIDGSTIDCDEVVIAAHADEALGLLTSPSVEESNLLGAFQYQLNKTFLHTDETLMPVRESVWSSWNYIARKNGKDVDSVSVTYWMNHLQGLNTPENYLVSLNPVQKPDPEKIIETIDYYHPVFDVPAIRAQKSLSRLQGHSNTWFVGSYFGYGFHEDALASAVNVCRQLGVTPPWEADNTESQPVLKSAA